LQNDSTEILDEEFDDDFDEEEAKLEEERMRLLLSILDDSLRIARNHRELLEAKLAGTDQPPLPAFKSHI